MNHSVEIGRAHLSELKAIHGIERSSFGLESFSLKQFRYLIKSKNSIFFVAKVSDSVAGYCIALKRKGSRKLRIYSIAVDENYRGRGIAQTLLDRAVAICKEENYSAVSLEVNEKNQAAKNLYLKYGFAITGNKPNYYKSGDTAITMLFYIEKPS